MNTMGAGKATADNLGELVASIAGSIVDDPTQVQVDQVTGETTVIYELRVAPEDVGCVIGKRGRTANAIRTVLSLVTADICLDRPSVVWSDETQKRGTNDHQLGDPRAAGYRTDLVWYCVWGLVLVGKSWMDKVEGSEAA
jgi:predicted RNA-binding protein YlqC (UPF0109 family)